MSQSHIAIPEDNEGKSEPEVFCVRNALYCFSKVRIMCTILASVLSVTITPYTIGMSKAKIIRNTFYLQMRMDKYQPSTRITIKKEIKTPMEAETHNYKIKNQKK